MTHNKTKQMYQCSVCKIKKAPFWREYNTFNPKLFCVDCAINNQGAKNIIAKDNNIGWLIPAIPVKDTFWGYTSIPNKDYHQLSYDILMEFAERNIIQLNEDSLLLQGIIMDNLKEKDIMQGRYYNDQ